MVSHDARSGGVEEYAVRRVFFFFSREGGSEGAIRVTVQKKTASASRTRSPSPGDSLVQARPAIEVATLRHDGILRQLQTYIALEVRALLVVFAPVFLPGTDKRGGLHTFRASLSPVTHTTLFETRATSSSRFRRVLHAVDDIRRIPRRSFAPRHPATWKVNGVRHVSSPCPHPARLQHQRSLSPFSTC